MAFTLNSIPGFADVAESVFDAENVALGIHINRVSSNAEFAMARVEVFYGTYVHGDTVPLPVSGIDGYAYTQAEVMHVWAVDHSVNPTTGWITGPDCLWYGAWLVDQSTSLVSCLEAYRRSGDHDNAATSNDGTLSVFTVAQRQRTNLALSAVPYYQVHKDSEFAQDKPDSTTLAKDVSRNAKHAAVATEVIYMGEFSHGGTVSAPVSPADGYVYDRALEVAWATSWRWTAPGTTAVQQPAKSLGQLQDLDSSVDSAGAVTIDVYYQAGDTVPAATHTNHGRIAVFAFCQRNRQEVNGRLNQGTAVPPFGWQLAEPVFGGANATTQTYVTGSPSDPAVRLVSAGASRPTLWQTKVFDVFNGDTWVVKVWARVVSGGGSAVLDLVSVNSGGTPVEIAEAITSSGSWTEVSFTKTFTADEPYAFVRLQGTANGGTYEFANARVVRTARTQDLHVDDFAEIDLQVFMFGETLRASNYSQVNKNARAAKYGTEVFAAVTRTNGQTVALPVSPQDGYTYTRDELAYVWDLNSTRTASHIRLATFGNRIDDSGVVALNTTRLSPGGPYNHDTDGSLRVIVIGKRKAELAEIYAGATDENPPSDSGSATADDDGTNDQINGS